MVELVFYTRKNCSLCEPAWRRVMEVTAGRDVTVHKVDIDSDSELANKYGWDIPVVMINGRYHSSHRVIQKKLAEALDRLGA